MKVKDLVKILLTLNQEAEIGFPEEDMIPKKTFNFTEESGWVEDIKNDIC